MDHSLLDQSAKANFGFKFEYKKFGNITRSDCAKDCELILPGLMSGTDHISIPL